VEGVKLRAGQASRTHVIAKAFKVVSPPRVAANIDVQTSTHSTNNDNNNHPQWVMFVVLDAGVLWSLSLLIAIVACFMLFAILCRQRALPPLAHIRTRLPPASPTSIPKQNPHFHPIRNNSSYDSDHSAHSLPSHPASWSSDAMFKQAVKHQAYVPPKKVPNQQRPLETVVGSSVSAVRPYAGTSGNIGKNHGAGGHGIKRTSSGLAKALYDQEDGFESTDSFSLEEEVKVEPYRSSTKPSITQPAVYFDEDDFDSDGDLDLEDPASIGTVQYPSLPPVQTRLQTSSTQPTRKAESQQSSYESQNSGPAFMPRVDSLLSNTSGDSSRRPTPAIDGGTVRTLRVSHSPDKNTKTALPKKKDQPRTSRRKLPWKTEPKEGSEETSTASSTLNKTSSTSEYLWNTTASAIKEQQQKLRLANKKSARTNEEAEDAPVVNKKKKKSTVPRIFLSDEQRHILNLIIEGNKSVFFTGSAGKPHWP
jgi:ATP-dependent DNA helicase PIF1